MQEKSDMPFNTDGLASKKSVVDHKKNAMNFLTLGEKEKALSEFALEIEKNPKDFDALHMAGVLIFELGNKHRGIALMGKAQEQGSSIYFYNNYGNMLLEMGAQAEAEDCFKTALALNPNYAEAHSNWGNLLLQRKDHPAALSAYSKALALKPDLADAWSNRGVARHQLMDFDRAIQDFEKALSLNASKDGYYSAYADLLIDMRQYSTAENLLVKALQINPNSSYAHCSMGRLKASLDNYKSAVESFMSAISADPFNSEAYKNCAVSAYHLGDTPSSQSLIKEALNLDPTNINLRWLDCFMHIPPLIESREEGVTVREKFLKKLKRFAQLDHKNDMDLRLISDISPFYLMYHGFDDRQVYERYAVIASEMLEKRFGRRLHTPNARGGNTGKIKICIVNAQIKNHSVWHSHTESLYKRLNKDDFELHTINLTNVAGSQAEYAKSNSVSYTDNFSDDDSVIDAVLKIGADIILYPEIGLHAQTWRLAARRLCENQVTMWGNPETTGMRSIDYFVSIEGFESAQSPSFFSEELVQIPLREHYYASRSYEPIPVDWSAYGLVQDEKVILCAGSAFKYQHRFFDIFEKIYSSFEDLQFIFFDQDDTVSEEVKKMIAQITCLAPERNRVVFLPWMNEHSYYALMRASHLMLDGLNFSGFNTAIKAIECGLPIVGLRSPLLRENFSAGLLSAIGADEWVANDVEQVMRVFTTLVADGASYQKFQRLLLEKGRALFDIEGPMPQLESFFKSIVKK